MADRSDDGIEVPRPGRPKAQIVPDQVFKLAAIGCTMSELAFFFSVSDRTIERHLAPPADGEEPSELYEAWTLGKMGMKLSLRRQQKKVAFGNGKAAAQVLLHMSRHQLGETEKAALGLDKGKDGGLVFVIEG